MKTRHIFPNNSNKIKTKIKPEISNMNNIN